MDVNSALFIAGGIAVLLLFGCTAMEEGPAPPDEIGGLGDAEVSTPEPEEEATLPEEDILIPPLESPPEDPPSGNTPDSDLLITEDDLFVEEVDDFDFISEEDIIEPL